MKGLSEVAPCVSSKTTSDHDFDSTYVLISLEKGSGMHGFDNYEELYSQIPA